MNAALLFAFAITAAQAAWLGTERLPQSRLLQALALVLFTVGAKLIAS